MLKINNNFIFISLFLLLFGNIIVWMLVFDLLKPNFLEVNFFDVGQGDAIFIETPQRHQILIDGGPDLRILEKLGKEMPFWDRAIDLVILTHPDRDHLIGLIEVFKKYEVEKILWTGMLKNTPEFLELKKEIEEDSNPPATLPSFARAPKQKIYIAKAGKKIIAGESVFEIFWPKDDFQGKVVEKDDDTSIVTRLILNKTSFLFTGDIAKSIENELVEEFNLDSDVLKVAHHGSKNSSSKEFIEKVLPQLAVISLSKNNIYGHPHQEVLDILEKYGIRILRTDLDGDIKIISDGEKIMRQ